MKIAIIDADLLGDPLNAPNPRVYKKLAQWANQAHMFLKKTFTEYVEYEAEWRRQRRGA